MNPDCSLWIELLMNYVVILCIHWQVRYTYLLTYERPLDADHLHGIHLCRAIPRFYAFRPIAFSSHPSHSYLRIISLETMHRRLHRSWIISGPTNTTTTTIIIITTTVNRKERKKERGARFVDANSRLLLLRASTDSLSFFQLFQTPLLYVIHNCNKKYFNLCDLKEIITRTVSKYLFSSS